MTAPLVTAYRLSGGAPVVLDRILSLSVNDTLESPAMAMRCKAVIDSQIGELGRVTVSQDGLNLFTGTVDRQTASLSGKGRVLSLEARSAGALLLDNEAQPCVLTNVGLATAFSLFCAPYGFRLASPGDGRTIAAYTARKGQSEWDAFTGFTRRAYGHTPYLRGNQIHVGAPRSVRMLTVGQGGYAFTELEHEIMPYHIISRIYLRDADGNYTSAVDNSSAAYYGARRKRYVIPANEFTDNIGLDANQRIRRSMLEKERVAVTLPGIVLAEPGQEARILGEDFAIHNLMVDELTWKIDSTGITTVLGLAVGLYYD